MTGAPAGRHLIDTSVWLDVLPRNDAYADLRARVDAILQARTAAMVGVVRAELLRGARDEHQYGRIDRLMAALPVIVTTEEDWAYAGRLGFELRRQALTVATPDLLIAAIAIRNGLIVLHRDRHFDLIAKRTSLKVESHL
jgi:predicted nucleic acid-binding protein